MNVCILVGNPKPESRTAIVAEKLVAAVLGDRADESTTTIIDLAEHAETILSGPSASMDRLLQAVVSSDLLVVASPTYKATYTGMLKAFLDRLPTLGLHLSARSTRPGDATS